MLTNGITPEAFRSLLEVRLDANYTEEQIELINAFGKGPVFCFADPGTGKTFTAVGGLLTAELYNQLPGNNIYALSFTKMATAELAMRHEKACKKLGVTRTVNFATLHKLCRDLLVENYRLLGMSKFENGKSVTMAQSYSLIENTCHEWGVAIDPNKIRNVVKACSALNSSLIFDEEVVRSKMSFKECHIDYDLFDRIRGLLFTYSLLTENISVQDIMLYTLMLMERHPEVSVAFKQKCKLMLVDEAQDLSLLHLRIISMMTDCPVFIGDMKQQIYAFNGACQEIVEAFFKQFPTAKTLKLTQSFRCKNEIADYATKIILPNNTGGGDFTGTGEGGHVSLHAGLYEDGADLEALCSGIREKFLANRNILDKDYLFLFRNNTSAIPIAEALFKNQLPFRINNYQPAYDVPVIKEMCELLQLADNPKALNTITALRYLIPEFKAYYYLEKHPYFEICTKTGASIFEVNYQFKDPGMGNQAMNLLLECSDMIRAGAPIKDLFNKLWPMYEANWVKPNAWRLENNVKYYLNSVNHLVHKNFSKFYSDEFAKGEVIKESDRREVGVRCYTMHASKGLEADVVYIIDADNGMVPNANKLERMLKAQCDMDAARQVREERSLCYVACTRAKEELHIVYTAEPAPMLLGENTYEQYDKVYTYYKVQGDDIDAFNRFTEVYVGNVLN